MLTRGLTAPPQPGWCSRAPGLLKRKRKERQLADGSQQAAADERSCDQNQKERTGDIPITAVSRNAA